MSGNRNPIHGRGSSDNPANRFDERKIDYDPDEETGEKPAPDTRLIRDDTKNIIAHNDSPDIPFDSSINPYRGCEHGCIYCYARPTHEYLGFSAGLDFESRIMVKYDAPRKLREQLTHPRWTPQPLVMSGVTDPYQPREKELRITRGCIEVLSEFMNPVSIITKNHLVTRDADLLGQMARYNASRVNISITTLDRELARTMEPRTTQPRRRLKAIEKLSEAGIRVGVMVAPIIPGLTDHEIASILKKAAEAGARDAGYTILRLPHGVEDMFKDWLEHHYPERKNKVLNRLKDMRNGRLNDPRFGHRMSGKGEYAGQISNMFAMHVKKLGMNKNRTPLSTEHFRPGAGSQLDMFSNA